MKTAIPSSINGRRKIFFLLWLVCSFLSTASDAQPSWEWARSGGGTHVDDNKAVAVDLAGNVYTVGSFQTSITFLGATYYAVDDADIYLAKYDTQGNPLWFKHIVGSRRSETAYAIEADSQGNIYVTGLFDGEITFGSYTFTSSVHRDLFFVKFDTQGNVVWAKQIGGTSMSTSPWGMTIDHEDNIFIAGDYSGYLVLDEITLDYTGPYVDFFVAKYDANGVIQMAFRVDNTGIVGLCRSVDVDSDGNIVVTGVFRDMLVAGPITLTSSNPSSVNSEDIFVLKFTGTGEPLWGRSAGGSAANRDAFAVTTDQDGNVFVGGYYLSDLEVDNSIVLTTQGSLTRNAFLVKYSSEGDVAWARRADWAVGGGGIMTALHVVSNQEIYAVGGGALGRYSQDGVNLEVISNGEFGDIDFDAEEILYTSGIFIGTIHFGPHSVSSQGSVDFFVAKLSIPGLGLQTWDRTIGGLGSDKLQSMIKTPDGNLLLGGESTSGVSGNKSTPSRGGRDYWIVKCDTLGNKLWDKSFGGRGNDFLTSLADAGDGGYFLCGYSGSYADGDKTHATRGGYDYWIIKIDASGNKLWDKAYGGTGNDMALKAIATGDGGLIIGGTSHSGVTGDKTEPSRGGADAWIVRLNSAGNMVWQKSLGGSSSEAFSDVKLLDDGTVLVGISSASVVSGDKTKPRKGGADFWLVSLDAAGNIITDFVLGGTGHDYVSSILPGDDGGVLISGYSRSNASGDKTDNNHDPFGDFWIVKLDSVFQKVWDKTYGSDTLDVLTESITTSANGYYLGGYSYSDRGGEKSKNSFGLSDFWILRIDGDGTLVWDKSVGGSGTEELTTLLRYSPTALYAGGFSNSGISGNKLTGNIGSDDFWIVRIDDHTAADEPLLRKTSPFADVQSGRTVPQGLVLYPNPASESIGAASIGEIHSVWVLDRRGTLVTGGLPAQQTSEATVYDISMLKPGIYFLQIRKRNGTVQVARFVKE
jgi:hypothetical protein